LRARFLAAKRYPKKCISSIGEQRGLWGEGGSVGNQKLEYSTEDRFLSRPHQHYSGSIQSLDDLETPRTAGLELRASTSGTRPTAGLPAWVKGQGKVNRVRSSQSSLFLPYVNLCFDCFVCRCIWHCKQKNFYQVGNSLEIYGVHGTSTHLQHFNIAIEI